MQPEDQQQRVAETNSTYGGDLFQFPFYMSPSTFKCIMPESTVLPRERRDNEFAVPVVLVLVVQEWLYIA